MKMKPSDYSKVFDISKPRPSNTSRPVIVGHQPTMPDPMVKRPTAPRPQPKTPAAISPGSDVDGLSYQAKTIAVTDEMKQEIAAAHAPLSNMALSSMAEQPEMVPTTTPATAGTVPPPPAPAEPQPPMVPATPPPTEPAAPTSPGLPPTPPPPPSEQNVQPNAPPSQVVNPQAAPSGPVQPVNEPHFQSLPVSHEPVTGPRMLRRVIVWGLVALLLIALAVYLLIDAGVISSNINLPVHIFNKEA